MAQRFAVRAAWQIPSTPSLAIRLRETPIMMTVLLTDQDLNQRYRPIPISWKDNVWELL